MPSMSDESGASDVSLTVTCKDPHVEHIVAYLRSTGLNPVQQADLLKEVEWWIRWINALDPTGQDDVVERAIAAAVEHGDRDAALRLAPEVARLRPMMRAVIITRLRLAFGREFPASEFRGVFGGPDTPEPPQGRFDSVSRSISQDERHPGAPDSGVLSERSRA